jgi:hypothetical protein
MKSATILSTFVVLALAAGAAAEEYLSVTLKELTTHPEKYLDKRIKVTGKVLGSVHTAQSVEADLWVVVIGDRPQPDDKLANQLIFPTYQPKIRAAEDGFNRDVIKRCHKLLTEARASGSDVTVYGRFHPAGGLRQYARGISLAIDRIHTGNVTIATDYGDMSEFRAKTPRRIQKAVKNGKSILKAVGKFF